MQVFEQLRRANQRDIRPWKMHRQVTQGLLKVMKKGCDGLRLSCLPGLAKHLRPRSDHALDIRRVNLARIRQDGPLPLLFGLPTRRPGGLPSRAHPLAIVQVGP